MLLLVLSNRILCYPLKEDYMELLCNISDTDSYSSRDEVINFLGFTVTIGILQYSV